MDMQENGKTGKRSAAPLLISIFWLVSTISAALGTVYLSGPESNITAREVGPAKHHESRVAHEADNHSTPVERPMRVAALEALHMKIKSGLRADMGPQDALLPSGPRPLLAANSTNLRPIASRSGLLLGHHAIFSARAPPARLG